MSSLYIQMEEQSKQVDTKPFSITIKVNAKREFYGEYSVRAETLEELEDNLTSVGVMFDRHTKPDY